MPRLKNCEICGAENTFIGALRSRKCIACKHPMDWMHKITCKNCGSQNRATTLELSSGNCYSCKKPLAWSVNPDSYVPNEIPLKARVIAGAFALILMALSVHAIYSQRLVMPYGGRRGRGLILEFIGFETIVPILAILLGAIGFLATVIDHYDRRFNEATYKTIINLSLGLSFFLYTISIFFGHRMA